MEMKPRNPDVWVALSCLVLFFFLFFLEMMKITLQYKCHTKPDLFKFCVSRRHRGRSACSAKALKSPPVWLSWWLVRVSKHQSASPEGKNRSMWVGFSYSRQWYLPIRSSVALAAGLTGSDSSQNLRTVWFIYFQGGPPFFQMPSTGPEEC